LLAYEEYRRTILSKAGSYLDLLRQERDRFKLDLLENKIHRAQCLPSVFFVFKFPKEYCNDNVVTYLNNLLISVYTTLLPAVSYLYTIN